MDPKSPGVGDAGRLRSNSDLPERHVLAVFANVKEVAGWSLFKSKCIEVFHCQAVHLEDMRLVFDMDNKGYVSKNVFLKFLEVFSPILPAQHPQHASSWSIAEIHDLLCNQIGPSFHSWLSREDAEERLRLCSPGTYLWRFARGCVLSIAVTVDTAQTASSVRHWRISRPAKEAYMFTVNGKTKHPSLKLFVERYRKFPLKVQEGVEVILTEGLPYTPRRHLPTSTSLELHQLLAKTVSAPSLNVPNTLKDSSEFSVVPVSGHSPPGTLRPMPGEPGSGHASMRSSTELPSPTPSPPGTISRGTLAPPSHGKLRTGSDPFVAVDLSASSGYISRGSPNSSPTGSVLITDPAAYVRRLTQDALPPSARAPPLLAASNGGSTLKEIDFTEIQLVQPPIGSGAFGVVSRGQWRGVDVAVKQVLAAEIDIDEFRREALTWQRLQHHPNIAHLVGVCTNRYPFCLVSDFYPRGSLYDILMKRKEDVDWPRLVWVAMTAAAGILHLHKEDVVHRDISARNILVQAVDGRWIAKVADFGLSRVKSRVAAEHQTKTAVGATKWLAPETLLEARYSEKSDAYSFGITMWEILYRTEPYENLTPAAVTMQVVRAEAPLRPPLDDKCPPPWQALMTECWAANPKTRPSFQAIHQRISDYVNSLTNP